MQDLKEFRKMVTKATMNVALGRHTVVDAYVITAFSLASRGNNGGIVTNISKECTYLSRSCHRCIEAIDGEKEYRGLHNIVIACDKLVENLDMQKIIVKTADGDR